MTETNLVTGFDVDFFAIKGKGGGKGGHVRGKYRNGVRILTIFK